MNGRAFKPAWWFITGVLACVALGCATGSSTPAAHVSREQAGEAEDEQPIPEDLREPVERARTIGRQLYVLDKVAAIGTDVLVEHIGDLEGKGLGGYLPLQEGDANGPKESFLVTFFTDETPARVAYQIRVAPERRPEFRALRPPEAAPESMLVLVRARQAAIDALPAVRQPINPVLLPGEFNGEQGVLVYLLAGTKDPNVAVFGQHFRALVPEGGDQVTYLKPLSKSALLVPLRGSDGKEALALAVTHLVTDYPLETHVFTSLLKRKAVFVKTSRGVWLVNGDQIAFRE